MKIKKSIFLLLIPFMAELVVSCCNCIEPVSKNYTNKSISVSNLDNSGTNPSVSTSASIIKTAYGIRIQLLREITACIIKPNSIFFQSAYANRCDCPPPNQFLPKDSIAAIKIFTLNDFDNIHPANSDISGYFKVYAGYSFSTIEEYLKKSVWVLYDDGDLEIEIDLLLMTAPALSNQHKFKIQIILSDGRILEQETSNIELI